MIRPINGHVLIEPLTHETFIPAERDTYEEIGVVLDFDDAFDVPTSPVWTGSGVAQPPQPLLKKGWKVYFDSWLAAKYPSDKPGEYYWLVRFEDIRAVQHGD